MNTPNYVIEHMPFDALINHANALQVERKELTAQIEELQRREAMLVDALNPVVSSEFEVSERGAERILTKCKTALSATSADSAAWLEQKHVEWLGDPVGRVVHGNIYPMHDRYPEGFIYALPTKGDGE